jgi:ABC-type glycerol-3-phosphate transport system substrate-binding protein
MYKKSIMILVALALILSACSSAATPAAPAAATEAAPAATEVAPAAAGAPVEITVWDYYGDTTPIKPLIPAFEKANPGIKVNFEEVGWDGFWQKLPIAISSGDVPDVVTSGLMWAPEYIVSGAYADLMPLSNGMLNGQPFDKVLPKGLLDACRSGDKVFGLPYDLDAYALYYRTDLFEAAGIKDIPTNWTDLAAALKKVSDPAKEVYGLEFDPSWNSWDPFLYYFGGQYIDSSGKAVFNSPEAVTSINFMKQLLADKTAVLWTADRGDLTSGIKGGTIGSFYNGPYMMGVIKTGAPELSGKWKIAMLPTDGGKAFGTHIGGTDLAIMAKSKHPAEAWKFVEYLYTLDSQVEIYTASGSVPAFIPAMDDATLTKPDPYFSNQAPVSIFKQTASMGRPNPTVKDWTKITEIINNTLTTVLTTDADVQKTLDKAVADANALMGK